MLIEGTTIMVPGVEDGSPDVVFNLAEIFVAEARQGEVAVVTPVKAPELLALFNKAWLETDKFIKKLAAFENKAEQAVGRVRAHMILNEVEGVLKAKGVPSTKESRDAVILLDPRYIVQQDRVDQIHAMVEWLRGKMKSFENSFTSVKKIMGEDAYNMSTRINNHNLSGGGSSQSFQQPKHNPSPNPTPTTAQTTVKSGYGKARYDR